MLKLFDFSAFFYSLSYILLESLMKAILCKKYGAPNVLQLGELPKPVPKPNEILIRVRAAEVTKTDCEMRAFKFAVKWFWLPLRLAMGVTKPRNPVLGGYFAGEVVALGDEVHNFNVGDNIFGSTQMRFGAYGQYVCLPASYTLVQKPTNISFEEAAAVPLGGLNALHFLRKANINAGDRVLINGAGGSIGSFAIQIARLWGAHVTAVDAAFKENFIRSLGAHEFIDYAKQDFTQNGETYDVIFDMVPNSSFEGCIKSLKADGVYLIGNPRLADMLKASIKRCCSGRQVHFAFARETLEELGTLKAMIEAEQIMPVVDSAYRMGQAAEAHKRVETERRLGSVVLTIS